MACSTITVVWKGTFFVCRYSGARRELGWFAFRLALIGWVGFREVILFFFVFALAFGVVVDVFASVLLFCVLRCSFWFSFTSFPIQEVIPRLVSWAGLRSVVSWRPLCSYISYMHSRHMYMNHVCIHPRI